MKYTKFSKYVANLADEMSLEDLLNALSDYMLESGFQTKSNFNREFRRVTAHNPAAWREQSRSETLAVVARVGAEDA